MHELINSSQHLVCIQNSTQWHHAEILAELYKCADGLCGLKHNRQQNWLDKS